VIEDTKVLSISYAFGKFKFHSFHLRITRPGFGYYDKVTRDSTVSYPTGLSTLPSRGMVIRSPLKPKSTPRSAIRARSQRQNFKSSRISWCGSKSCGKSISSLVMCGQSHIKSIFTGLEVTSNHIAIPQKRTLSGHSWWASVTPRAALREISVLPKRRREQNDVVGSHSTLTLFTKSPNWWMAIAP